MGNRMMFGVGGGAGCREVGKSSLVCVKCQITARNDRLVSFLMDPSLPVRPEENENNNLSVNNNGSKEKELPVDMSKITQADTFAEYRTDLLLYVVK